MTCRSLVSAALLLAVAATGCRSTPPLASRPLTEAEAAWAAAIQRSYPGWRPPHQLPTREHRDRRPAPAPEPVPLAAAPATRAVPERETVVEVPLPAPSGPRPSATVGTAVPARPVVEPEINDVDFVPAD